MIKEVENVSVVGAGSMGSRIAQLFLQCDVNVNIIDQDPNALENARIRIADQLELLSKHNLFHEAKISEFMEKLTISNSISTVSEADLVIEAVPEKIKLKQDVFKEIEFHCSRETLIATNTSGISVNEIVSALKQPERAIGTHFFMPADIIPLVEVVKSEFTSDSTIESVMTMLEKIGKKPVLINKDIPGFIANRIQHALAREAISLVESGIASAKDIDTVVRYSIGMRLLFTGPLEQRDLNGLDVHYDIASYLYKDLENRDNPSELLAEKVEKGELGLKSGRGFYHWDKDSESITKKKNEQIYELLKWLKNYTYKGV